MRRLLLRALAAAAFVTPFACLHDDPPALADTAPMYVALGDSLAASVQPDANGHDRATSDGYAERVWAARTHVTPQLQLVKLGRGGETAATMVRSRKPGPSQLEQAEQVLRSGAVVLVTVDVGANEVERCQVGTGFAAECVERGLRSLAENLPRIIDGLRAAGGDKVRLVGINYYNSFLGRWVTGDDGRALALASVSVERRINGTLAAVYRRERVALADVTPRFHTGQIHRYVESRAHGRVPLAVERTCRLTWACSARYDDHTNSRGYAVIARTVLSKLR